MRKISLFLLLSFGVFGSFAHEYVLVAPKFSINKGDSLEMHLFVANGFNVEMERPMQSLITRKFELITNEGTTDLKETTKDGALPIIQRPVNFEGLGLVYLERDYDRVSLGNDDFEAYLKEDHIENIKLNTEDKAKNIQTERYSRYIKSLVRSNGDISKDTLYRKILGNNIEIILLQNPYLLKKGSVLQAKVLFKGEPLKNKVISAQNRKGSLQALSFESRTDDQGICSFKIEREGTWFINTTHMIACPDKKDTDWESFWTSYSFAIE